ncbi:general odorant-binding protein 72-like [Cydia strobilella]|uniref:general odorant-binding protein 72-like n=1 Tax=Cydia strobilella TaxID=1100964 RepID=UPI003006C34D
MDRQTWMLVMVVAFLVNGCDALTKAQMKKSAAAFKKKCMAKENVSEDMVGDIEKGKFIEEKGVMCYIACIYQMANVVKNNKLSYEASIKQIDIMYPAEMKEPAKKSVEACKDVSKKYKDLCEASFWTAKCIYEDDPKNFFFA